MSEVCSLLSTCGQFTLGKDIKPKEREVTNGAKSGAEPNKALYSVKKKVEGN